MKVLVLGATGGTGRLIVRDALAKGHSVVALVCSKARALDLPGADMIEAMPVTRMPSFAPWGLLRNGRGGVEIIRRDANKFVETEERKPSSVMAFKSLHDFNLTTG